MRIDRLLCELNLGTRSQVKELLKKGLIRVNDEVIIKPETKVDENTAVILYGGKEYRYRAFVYFMMNKPAGVVTATEDGRETTVLDLFKAKYEEARGGLTGIPLRELFPVGRLDKDTVGLLVLTNDGALAHEILSPKRHVPKTYYVRTDRAPEPAGLKVLETGVEIEAGVITAPAKVEWQKEKEGYLTITEGRFHQVKRMFHSIGVEVVYLKRVSMGKLHLDKNLGEGEIRELTREEVDLLCLKK